MVHATKVSRDGSVIGGYFFSPGGAEAFRWDQNTGAVGLGDLPGGSFQSQAFGVSGNGSIIVGGGTSENGGDAACFLESTTNTLPLRFYKLNLALPVSILPLPWAVVLAAQISQAARDQSRPTVEWFLDQVTKVVLAS